MTLKQARKILGKDAKGISDERLKIDIEIAELFKSLLFNKLTNSSVNSNAGMIYPNMP